MWWGDDHCALYSAKVQSERSLIYAPPLCLHGLHKDIFHIYGIGRLHFDLNCYSFTTTERIINVLFTDTSRMTVKSWKLSAQWVFRNGKKDKTTKLPPKWNMRLLELWPDVPNLVFQSAQMSIQHYLIPLLLTPRYICCINVDLSSTKDGHKVYVVHVCVSK